MSKPIIRKFLDLSTAHLPAALREYGTREGVALAWGDPAVVTVTDFGFWLWVPDDPQDSAEAGEEAIAPAVLAIQLYARKHDCDYVLFDADGETNDDLPVFED
jgi:hypothetical protein